MDRENLRDDELMHWKYLKKVRGKNGKWIYYYDKKGLKRDVKDALGYDERQRAGETQYQYERARNAYRDYTREAGDKIKDKALKTKIDDMLRNDLSKAAEEALAAKKAYLKTPLGKLDQLDDVVDKGRSVVSKLLSKMAKKLEPKKETLIKYK